ncbi:DNA polymerase ligase N-terminal domain-containing protein [Umezawaea sp.]|uniref:DNA polymerase ligase N-terminal domain-containing protein n=1 Tax=Umezawaea sp. TaxID=1955258 RepID=UPI002ED63620
MADLSEYRRKRDPGRTPEPVPDPAVLPHGADDTFVIQEHHASSLHWDVRLERDGVLVSWAVPKGLPPEPGVIRLAVHTEDHPLEYAGFSGVIPKGEYGGGEMFLWDRGRYETVKWSDREVDVVLHGERVDGEFVFFRRDGSSGRDWMVRRRHVAARPDWVSLPADLRPMLATDGVLPPAEQDGGWSYEFAWDGVRVVVRVEGGRVVVADGRGEDVTSSFPELQGLGARLGMTQAVLDGVVVAFDGGRPSASALRRRTEAATAARARRAAKAAPVTFLAFDLLHLEGRSTLELPHEDRRVLLEELGVSGPSWLTPPAFRGGGEAVLAASGEQGLGGVVAKRSDSVYSPGVRSAAWVRVAVEGRRRG